MLAGLEMSVPSYDSLSRHVGLDILEYWSEMLRL